MATLIGLAIRVKLLRSLPPRFKARSFFKNCEKLEFCLAPLIKLRERENCFDFFRLTW